MEHVNQDTSGYWLTNVDCKMSRISPQVGDDQCLLPFMSTAQQF